MVTRELDFTVTVDAKWILDGDEDDFLDSPDEYEKQFEAVVEDEWNGDPFLDGSYCDVNANVDVKDHEG